MQRRDYLTTLASLGVTVFATGCVTGIGGRATVKETIVRNVSSAGTQRTPVDVTPTDSNALAFQNVVFQPAGQKGALVAGDVTNRSDRTLEDFYVEVTLYDQNNVEDNIIDSRSILEEHDSLQSGQTWQWSATFNEEPSFDVSYYTVTGAGEFE